MHPEVISDKPGKCPKCGMDLVEIENHSKHQSDPEPKSDNSVLKRNSENGKVSFGGKRFVMICMSKIHCQFYRKKPQSNCCQRKITGSDIIFYRRRYC
jgi:hypothetical protein